MTSLRSSVLIVGTKTSRLREMHSLQRKSQSRTILSRTRTHRIGKWLEKSLLLTIIVRTITSKSHKILHPSEISWRSPREINLSKTTLKAKQSTWATRLSKPMLKRARMKLTRDRTNNSSNSQKTIDGGVNPTLKIRRSKKSWTVYVVDSEFKEFDLTSTTIQAKEQSS